MKQNKCFSFRFCRTPKQTFFEIFFGWLFQQNRPLIYGFRFHEETIHSNFPNTFLSFSLFPHFFFPSPPYNDSRHLIVHRFLSSRFFSKSFPNFYNFSQLLEVLSSCFIHLCFFLSLLMFSILY